MKITLTIPKDKFYLYQFIDKQTELATKIKSTQERIGVMKALDKIKHNLSEGKAYIYDTDTDELDIYNYSLEDYYFRWGQDFKIPSLNEPKIK